MLDKKKLLDILYVHAKGGVFVEIGGYDGVTNSHTASLADSGWKGYYFEPVIEFANKCLENHKDNDVTVLPVAVGKLGIRSLYVSDQLSTLNDEEYQSKVSNLEWFKDSVFKERKVMVVSPLWIPKCNLLVIDVESSEYDILENMIVRPEVIIVELHEESKEWQKIHDTQKSVTLLENMGYSKIYNDEIDSIFVLI